MATELTGVFTHLDENGNEIELYPKVKTDTSLSKSGEPADAKTVGDLCGSVGYYGSNDANSSGWYKVYSGSLTGYANHGGRLSIMHGFSKKNYGVIIFRLRCDNTTTLTVDNLLWETRIGFDVGDVIIVTSDNTWTLYVNNRHSQHGRIKIRVLESFNTSGNWVMQLKRNETVETTAPTPTVVASDGATVNYANSAGSATKATKDSANQQITSTYIKGLSASGMNITYTKGDGTTGTITTKDPNLENYIPFSDTNVTLKKGGMLAPNGDTYLKDYSKWTSSWLNTLQAATNRHDNGINITVPTYNDFGGITDRNIYLKNVLKWICANYPGVTNRTWMFNCNPDSQGWSVIFIYSTSDTVDGLPRYGSGIFIPLTIGTGEIITYGCHEGKFVYKTNTPSPSFSLSGTTLTITT